MDQPVSTRIKFLDSLRGTAVYAMIISHTLYFFAQSKSDTIGILILLTNTFGFCIFLFVSAAVSVPAYLIKSHTNTRLVKRLLVLLISYYILNVLALAKELNSPSDLVALVLLQKVAPFTEFLLVFFFLGISIVMFPQFYRWISQTLFRTIVVGTAMYILGVVLFYLPVHTFFIPYKAFLVGHEQVLGFPIFWYFPIVTLGLWFGKNLQQKQPVIRTLLLVGSVSTVFFGITYILFQATGLPFLNAAVRWPPSLGFLSLNISFFCFLIILTVKTSILARLTAFVGYYSYAYTVLHLGILFVVHGIGVAKLENIPALLSIGFIFGSCVLVIKILTKLWKKQQLSYTPFEESVPTVYALLAGIFTLLLFVTTVTNQTASIYGNFLITKDLVAVDDLSNQAIVFPTDSAQTETVTLKTNARWFLTTDQQKTLTLTVTFSEKLAELLKILPGKKVPQFIYEIPELKRAGDLYGVTLTSAETSIVPSELPIGSYTIRITSTDDEASFQSESVPFYVSAPVYVAWTLDWEGWDVSDRILTTIEDMSTKHADLPVTHFFNPRMYIPGAMPPNRVATITEWVTKRHERFGDEIAMHLHMHTDMLKSAGITPKTAPRWGYNGMEGYDVPTTAYTYDELIKLFSWAKAQFAFQNFPTPIGYRAGGWFGNKTVLQALQDTGFLYDSSGREQSLWGGNTQSPWQLSVTSQPYYPSQENVNLPGEKSLGILQIPNNGGNTYEHTAEELINRLTKNYSDGVTQKPLSIVYMSHPQWGQTELPKMQTFLTYSDKFLYLRDKGPILFVTTEKIYEVFK